jgi:hypothetical protein
VYCGETDRAISVRRDIDVAQHDKAAMLTELFTDPTQPTTFGVEDVELSLAPNSPTPAVGREVGHQLLIAKVPVCINADRFDVRQVHY